MREKLYAALKQYWGYGSFRPVQLEVVERVCRDEGDTLVLMPTGGGKSLLYQLPTIVRGGVCVVVTPLISLMKDQVDRLSRHGIKAIAVHSGLTPRQIDVALDNCVYGDVRFLYVAPERLTSEVFRMRVARMNVTLLAVDEAHCISEWGYDFRPTYLRIAEIRRIVPDVKILALTASATEKVCEDVCAKLLFRNGQTVRSTFARPNISYTVRQTDDREGQLMRVVENVPGTGIVYTRTRDGAEKLAETLQQRGIKAECYHGGMTHIMRSIRQEAWTKGECRVMVATNAFGMGIDKADVRFVVHWDICDSLEEYYQEAGRAGRDGRRSYAVLLAASDDRGRAAKRFELEFPSIEAIRECYEAIFNYLQVGVGEGKHSSFAFNIFDFAKRNRMFVPSVVNAIKILQQNGYMVLTDEGDNPPRLLFTVGRDDLYKARIEREELDHILRIILRLYQGLFNDFQPIDVDEIAQSAGYATVRVNELLQRLWQLRIIKYIPGNRSPLLIMTEERLPTADVLISHQSYHMRKERTTERLESIFRYAANRTECRSVFIQSYFGERDAQPCGVCDLCLARRRSSRGEVSLDERILAVASAERLTVKELVDRFAEEPGGVIEAIDRLAEQGILYIDNMSRVNVVKR
ncbi:MAG: RecQ family ATP-dependent DNA helicase [Rikenellaceae bacterium]|jgi:ATP-dependent DNA helicase RecQ|nr:RecQ family ATP-dependent DNA helicase [Rikenellaceae bacterium]